MATIDLTFERGLPANVDAALVKAATKTCLPIADGAVGANVQPVGATRTTPSSIHSRP